MPPMSAAFSVLLLLFVFARLVRNTAAGLASRLAGRLAFAAAAVFRTFAKVLCVQSFDRFHGSSSI